MVNLNVPFDSQVTDEKENPESIVGKEWWRNCNINCLSMVLGFYGKNVTEKLLWELIEGPSGKKFAMSQGISDGVLRVYHRLLAWAGRQILLIDEKYCRDIEVPESYITKIQVQNVLRKGFPVILGAQFPDCGHVIVVKGYDDLGWFVNDPAGDREKKYFNPGGDNVHYRYEDVDQFFFPDGKCWTATIITDGKKTVTEALA